jgi:hypothetical protein
MTEEQKRPAAKWAILVPLTVFTFTLSLALGAVAVGSDQPKNSTEKIAPPPQGSELNVLFLGNSLTAVNDLPALVQSMAATGGVRLSCQAITVGGASLEDHWNAGEARTALDRKHWDYVVMQQGPSSRPKSQAHLQEWAARWADEARAHGATPALYMVWPIHGQADGFKLVAQSYRRAAKASNSRLLPVGEAWERALRSDRSLQLYQPDKLHPTLAGTYLAALVITQGLTGIRPLGIPASLKLADGRTVELPGQQVKQLHYAAEKAIGQPRLKDPAAR